MRRGGGSEGWRSGGMEEGSEGVRSGGMEEGSEGVRSGGMEEGSEGVRSGGMEEGRGEWRYCTCLASTSPDICAISVGYSTELVLS